MSDLNNSEGFLTEMAWNDLVGDQEGIALSGFEDDLIVEVAKVLGEIAEAAQHIEEVSFA